MAVINEMKKNFDQEVIKLKDKHSADLIKKSFEATKDDYFSNDYETLAKHSVGITHQMEKTFGEINKKFNIGIKGLEGVVITDKAEKDMNKLEKMASDALKLSKEGSSFQFRATIIQDFTKHITEIRDQYIDEVSEKFNENMQKIDQQLDMLSNNVAGNLLFSGDMTEPLTSSDIGQVQKLYQAIEDKERTESRGGYMAQNKILETLREGKYDLDAKFTLLQTAITDGTIKSDAEMRSFFSKQGRGERIVLAMQLYIQITNQAVERGKYNGAKFLDGKLGPLTFESFKKHLTNEGGVVDSISETGIEENAEQKRQTELTKELTNRMELGELAIKMYSDFLQSSYDNIWLKWLPGGGDEKIKTYIDEVATESSKFYSILEKVKGGILMKEMNTAKVETYLNNVNLIIEKVFNGYTNPNKPDGELSLNELMQKVDPKQEAAVKEIKSMLTTGKTLNQEEMKFYRIRIHELMRSLDVSSGSMYSNSSKNADHMRDDLLDVKEAKLEKGFTKIKEIIEKPDSDIAKNIFGTAEAKNKVELSATIKLALGSELDDSYDAGWIADKILEFVATLEVQETGMKEEIRKQSEINVQGFKDLIEEDKKDYVESLYQQQKEMGITDVFKKTASFSVMEKYSDYLAQHVQGKQDVDSRLITEFIKMEGVGGEIGDEAKNRAKDMGINMAIEVALAVTTFGVGSAIYRGTRLAKWGASFSAKLSKYPKLLAALKLSSKGIAYNAATNVGRTLLSKDLENIGDFGESFKNKLSLRGVLLDTFMLGWLQKINTSFSAGGRMANYASETGKIWNMKVSHASMKVLAEELGINVADLVLTGAIEGKIISAEDVMTNLLVGFALGRMMEGNSKVDGNAKIEIGVDVQGNLLINGKSLDENTKLLKQQQEKEQQQGKVNMSDHEKWVRTQDKYKNNFQNARKIALGLNIVQIRKDLPNGIKKILDPNTTDFTKQDILDIQNFVGATPDGILGPDTLSKLDGVFKNAKNDNFGSQQSSNTKTEPKAEGEAKTDQNNGPEAEVKKKAEADAKQKTEQDAKEKAEKETKEKEKAEADAKQKAEQDAKQKAKEDFEKLKYKTPEEQFSYIAKEFGLNPDTATAGTIKAAYRKKALEHHPDQHTNDTKEQQEFHEKEFIKYNTLYEMVNGKKVSKDMQDYLNNKKQKVDEEVKLKAEQEAKKKAEQDALDKKKADEDAKKKAEQESKKVEKKEFEMSKGKLDIEKILKSNNMPQETLDALKVKEFQPESSIEIDGKTFYVSPIISGGVRDIAMVYVEVDGKVQTLVYYKSISDGGRRLNSPHKSQDFAKGAKGDNGGYRHYTRETKPHEDLVTLFEKNSVINGDGNLYNSHENIRKKYKSDENINHYEKEIEYRRFKSLEGLLCDNQVMNGQFYGDPKKTIDINKIKNIQYPDGFIPDFKIQPKKTYKQSHTILSEIDKSTGKTKQDITIEVYEGQISTKDGKLIKIERHMAKDKDGRVWIERIRPDLTNVSSFGVADKVFDFGVLDLKPIDYDARSGSDQVSRIPKSHRVELHGGIKDNYSDITSFLAELAPIKQYKEAKNKKQQTAGS